jgi:hypothetical protein
MVIIPGGTDFFDRRFDDFVVGYKHSVFEWCKIFIDQNPNATWPILLSATANSRERRLTMLGASGSNEPVVRPHPTEPDVYADGTEEEFNEAVRITLTFCDDKAPFRTMNQVYQQLAEGIKTGRIQYRPVYLDDQPGELDLTLCVIGRDPVFDIADRVGGYGRAIEEMLARRRQEQTSGDRLRQASREKIDDTIAAVYDEAERVGGKPPNTTELRTLVKAKLAAEGLTASIAQILEIAREPKHATRRWKPGHPKTTNSTK